MTTIIHLVDDTTPGGVMRVLDHFRSSTNLARIGEHRVITVSRSQPMPERYRADVIVSHLSISWRRLPWFMGLRALHPETPMIHVEHSYTRAFTAHRVLNRARFRTLLSTTFSLFERVVAVSADQGAWLAERGLVAPESLTVIPSAVDVSTLLNVKPATDRPRIVGAIGRLVPAKGFDILVRAMAEIRVPELELHIYGDGADRAALETLAQGNPRIRFMGYTPAPDAAYAAVDIIAMPSRWEPYGLVGLEARAAGRPLLVSKVDGLIDQTFEGAIAVSENNVRGWVEALERLSQPSNPLRLSHARAEAVASVERFRSAWSRLIADVLEPERVLQAA